jgi:hypothetical protein
MLGIFNWQKQAIGPVVSEMAIRQSSRQHEQYADNPRA